MTVLMRWPQPDFLAPTTRRPAWVAWWAAGAALVLATALLDAWSASRELQAQRDRLARASARLARATPAAGPAPSVPAAGRAEVEAARAARQVVDRLGHPWGQIVANVEAETPPGVQWLLFDHDGASPELRLEGTAPDLASVLHLVDDLGGHAGWSDVVLSRLLAPDAAAAPNAGPPAWRFELRARLDVARLASAQRHGRR